MCNNEPGHRCENCPGEQGSNRLAQPTAIINKTATTATTTTLAPTRSRSDSDKVSSSPTDIEAEYLDIKCCGNSKLCGTTDVHCADEDEEEEDDRAHVHMHDHNRHLVGSSQDHQRPRTFSNGPGPLPTGTWEEKISQLAPHGHEVDVTLTADEAWKTLKVSVCPVRAPNPWPVDADATTTTLTGPSECQIRFTCHVGRRRGEGYQVFRSTIAAYQIRRSTRSVLGRSAGSTQSPADRGEWC